MTAAKKSQIAMAQADDRLLEGMIDQMLKTTAQANAAIEDALAFVEASNERIVAMEAGAHAIVFR